MERLAQSHTIHWSGAELGQERGREGMGCHRGPQLVFRRRETTSCHKSNNTWTLGLGFNLMCCYPWMHSKVGACQWEDGSLCHLPPALQTYFGEVTPIVPLQLFISVAQALEKSLYFGMSQAKGSMESKTSAWLRKISMRIEFRNWKGTASICPVNKVFLVKVSKMVINK